MGKNLNPASKSAAKVRALLLDLRLRGRGFDEMVRAVRPLWPEADERKVQVYLVSVDARRGQQAASNITLRRFSFDEGKDAQ